MNATLRWTTLAVLPLLAAGCPKIGNINLPDLSQFTPKLSFDKVKLTDVDFEGADAKFVFNVNNPNPLDVKVASFKYDLKLVDQPFLAGDNPEGIALKAQGDSKLKIPVGIKFADALNLASSIKGADELPFTIKGNFGFNTPIGEIKVPYEEKGQLPVLRPPKIGVKGIKVGKVDLLKQTAGLTVNLVVANNQKTQNLSFADFDYNLSLGGKKVASGLVDTLGDVAPGAEEVVALPINIQLLELGSTIVSAITNKDKLDVGLGAKVKVNTPLGAIPLSVDETGKVQLQ